MLCSVLKMVDFSIFFWSTYFRTIHSDSKDEERKTPNPNVLIELGFAIAYLGWNRIVLLFNTAFGDINKDIPFDLSSQRITPFSCNENIDDQAKMKLESKKLTDTIYTALKSIIDDNPTKAYSNKEFQEAELKLNRDIENLELMFSHFNTDIFQKHIEYLPRVIYEDATFFWEGLKVVLDKNDFNFYDEELSKYSKKLNELLSESFSCSSYYHASTKRDYATFYMPGDVFPNKNLSDAWERIEKVKENLNKVFREFIIYIQKNYLEIDIKDFNQKSFIRYKNFFKKDN